MQFHGGIASLLFFTQTWKKMCSVQSLWIRIVILNLPASMKDFVISLATLCNGSDWILAYKTLAFSALPFIISKPLTLNSIFPYSLQIGLSTK